MAQDTMTQNFIKIVLVGVVFLLLIISTNIFIADQVNLQEDMNNMATVGFTILGQPNREKTQASVGFELV